MPPERIRTVNVTERPTSCRIGLLSWLDARVKEVGFVSARDRAIGEMSVVARREIATWSFRPFCEWINRRSLPNKMSLERLLALDDPAQIGAVQLIKSAADTVLDLNQVRRGGSSVVILCQIFAV